METKDSPNENPSTVKENAAIFATLFAQPCAINVTLPPGRYDAQSQLYLDATTGRPVLICPTAEGKADVRASEYRKHSECWTGQGTQSVVDDSDDEHYTD